MSATARSDAAAKPDEKPILKNESMSAIRKHVRKVRLGFKDIVRRLYKYDQNLIPFDDLQDYLKVRARVDLGELEHHMAKELDLNAKWRYEIQVIVLTALLEGEVLLQRAKAEAKLGQLDASNFTIAEAAVYFGRLTMLFDMHEAGRLRDIGTLEIIFNAGQRGGIRSGEARRATKAVPSPAALAMEKVKLLDGGRSPRDIAAVLAKRYGCTPDHIRKELKKQD